MQPDAAAFYCEVCRRQLRDSRAFLDHLTSTAHNDAAKKSTKVLRVPLRRVQEKVDALLNAADK